MVSDEELDRIAEKVVKKIVEGKERTVRSEDTRCGNNQFDCDAGAFVCEAGDFRCGEYKFTCPKKFDG